MKLHNQSNKILKISKVSGGKTFRENDVNFGTVLYLTEKEASLCTLLKAMK